MLTPRLACFILVVSILSTSNIVRGDGVFKAVSPVADSFSPWTHIAWGDHLVWSDGDEHIVWGD